VLREPGQCRARGDRFEGNGIIMVRRRKKPEITERHVRGTQFRRIRIPQPDERPIRVVQGKPITSEKYKPNYWWFTEHRRGIYRPLVGEDPLEARAVPYETVKGSLPERIVYRWLTSRLRLVPDVDFDFHSSLFGGRVELGGIDIDFLFPNIHLALEVHGPTHTQYLRQRKDEEKRQDLADMGYTVYQLWDHEIYNEEVFEDKMRRIFFIRPGYNAFYYAGSGNEAPGFDPEMAQAVYDSLLRSEEMLEGYKVVIGDPIIWPT
jgi:hypothetical protein